MPNPSLEPSPKQATSPAWMSVPAFWPMALATSMFDRGVAAYAKNIEFAAEEIKIHAELRPKLATPNRLRLDLRTMALRDYGEESGLPGGIPTLIDAPHAGHTAIIADYHKGQSLVQTLLDNGIGRVALTDWKSATGDMKDFEVDNYLADMVVVIDDLGGRVNLVGLCQGGWMAAMIAARFPDKVNSLVLAGDGGLCAPCRSDGDCLKDGVQGACVRGEFNTEQSCAVPSKKPCFDATGTQVAGACAGLTSEAPSPSQVGCYGGVAFKEIPPNYCQGVVPFSSSFTSGCYSPKR